MLNLISAFLFSLVHFFCKINECESETKIKLNVPAEKKALLNNSNNEKRRCFARVSQD